MLISVLSILLVIVLGAAVFFLLQLQKAKQDNRHKRELSQLREAAARERLAALNTDKKQILIERAQHEAALKAARQEEADIAAKLKEAQQECGLEGPLSATDFSEWLRDCAAAQKAEAEQELLADRLAPLFKQERAVKERLSALNRELHFLAALADDFFVLLAAAKTAETKIKEQIGAIKKEREIFEKCRGDIARRQLQLESAAAEIKRIEAKRAAAGQRIFGFSLPPQALGNSLSPLHNLYNARQKGGKILRAINEAEEEKNRLQREFPVSAEADFNIGSELALADQDKKQAEEAYTEAVAARAETEKSLRDIDGGADIASYEQEKQFLGVELAECAEEYLRSQIGVMLAREAMRRYRDAHRGGMIEAAERAFAELTRNAYPHLETRIDGKKEFLLAIAADGKPKRVEEMSTGARFQLYMALRAAAYEQLLAQGKNLPFFCDDVFETFDDERTRAACRLMQHIGRRGQAIYFTHHRHVAEIARKVCGGNNVRIHEL